uniref:Uncharacterized protein n=1 Tax=Anguilla anguilla TaxID=7936 RepID=A0A0E9VVT1_ANGAN
MARKTIRPRTFPGPRLQIATLQYSYRT